MAAHDYASVFALTTPEATRHTPEEWARAVLEDAPVILGQSLTVGWCYLMRFALAPIGTPSTVRGWPIADQSPSSLNLSASGPLLEGQNMVLLEPDLVRWATVVRYRRPLGRALWAAAAAVHHRTLPILLRNAESRLAHE